MASYAAAIAFPTRHYVRTSVVPARANLIERRRHAGATRLSRAAAHDCWPINRIMGKRGLVLVARPSADAHQERKEKSLCITKTKTPRSRVFEAAIEGARCRCEHSDSSAASGCTQARPQDGRTQTSDPMNERNRVSVHLMMRLATVGLCVVYRNVRGRRVAVVELARAPRS
jgi:hypothetical protein